MPSILEAKDLAKNYGDFQAVKGISFDIREGEIFSLLGPNGAGKTTTIAMLSTLFKPTSGDAIHKRSLGDEGADGRQTGYRRCSSGTGAL